MQVPISNDLAVWKKYYERNHSVLYIDERGMSDSLVSRESGIIQSTN